jgi:5-methylcytosine-specific restriction protein A
LYDRSWRRVRLAYLAENPLCADPFQEHGDRPVAATEVHHLVPHRGDPGLFWDESNWAALCHACHSRATLAEVRQ